jgi:hypothetical protein
MKEALTQIAALVAPDVKQPETMDPAAIVFYVREALREHDRIAARNRDLETRLAQVRGIVK